MRPFYTPNKYIQGLIPKLPLSEIAVVAILVPRVSCFKGRAEESPCERGLVVTSFFFFFSGFPHDIKTGALISADLLFLAISTTLVPGYLINSQYFSKAI